ncbi:efflux RND transporter periplasmic adaptor subunit [Aureimonas jatrophae]|jgi:RND family efflux transporter MFP subunit|uniref:RND family efflux transporter, MFP subunit n=1 Tax=Aureimonas jatrophae TaxID=1166073 RepID=A0A1H0J5J5_9HYPH|nr:efflux RND transporter periplasmic adaptor subunit [Aureimonas jatrophae]MBB3951588.1 RND family efflux transporter MFP subunit [Aureimonas jatrophae]SDO38872.1 RND family efflux transporter, MFP subunit [Aureimonas jatrophae]
MAGRIAKVGGVVAVAVLLAAGARVYSQGTKASDVAAPLAASAPAQPVELAAPEVTNLQPQDLSRIVRISGSTAPARRAVLTARVSGQIAALPADVGDAVEAGAVLARFDEEPLRSALDAKTATLDARAAQLRLARSVLERNERLGTAGIASEATRLSAEADVLNLEAQMRALEAEVADARRNLADATLAAPFAGTVSERMVEVGQSVPSNADLLTVVDLGRMEVEALVPTSRIAEIRSGQTARIRVEGYGDRSFEARVDRVAPVAIAGSRAVRVFLSVDNGDGALRGGMFAIGEIEVERLEARIALPPDAVRHDERGTFVLKAEGNRLSRQAVELGERFEEADVVVVRSGLRAGDTVVTAPLPDLKPDTDITIADAS